MIYRVLADLLVGIHVGYVAFVVFGLLAILLGWALGWQWVHNRWFRCIHLLMIAIVAFEAIAGFDCPLTVWENSLRALSGGEISETSFVGRLFRAVIFLDLPPWMFNVMHVSFAAIILSTFWFVPVRWSSDKQEKQAPTNALGMN